MCPAPDAPAALSSSSFNQIDEDGGGTLDHAELRDALTRVQEKVQALHVEEARTRDGQQKATEWCEQLDTCAMATRAALDEPENEWMQMRALKKQKDVAAEEEAERQREVERMAAAERERAARAEEAAEAARKAAEEEAKRQAIEQRRREEELAVLEPSSSWATKLEELRKMMQPPKEACEESAERIVEGQVGRALVAKAAVNPMEFVKGFDRKVQGELDRVEFRQVIRSFIRADNKSIDTLFASVDDDGSGSLEVSELALWLMRVEMMTKHEIAEEELKEKRAAALEGLMTLVEDVIAVTRTAEEALAARDALGARKEDSVERAAREAKGLAIRKQSEGLAALEDRNAANDAEKENTAHRAKRMEAELAKSAKSFRKNQKKKKPGTS